MKPDNIDLEIGKFLKIARTTAGFKIINVAKGIGVSESTICKIESGKMHLSISRLIKMFAF